MAILGIDKLVFGVEDMKAAKKFYTDFGLKQVADKANHARFQTVNRAEIELYPVKAKGLPKAIQSGSTLRELIWGVDSKADLKRIAAELKKDRPVTVDKDGTVHSTDPMGLGIAFRMTKRVALERKVIPMNSPELVSRIDERAIYYKDARPLTIGHVVLNVPSVKAHQDFYIKRIGFHLTDIYRGRGVFLRTGVRAGHHQLFLLEDEQPSLNHVGFGVRDINEMFGGGYKMQKSGWGIAVGPGRHIVSSCYFWYFKSPVGAPNEYFCDEDYCTENWKPKVWDPAPETFAEWLLPKGIVGKRPLPPTRTKKDVSKKAKAKSAA
jgi:catechol 2,3-dioxygenase-like lactoylglutathione lyase family enzyme